MFAMFFSLVFISMHLLTNKYCLDGNDNVDLNLNVGNHFIILFKLLGYEEWKDTGGGCYLTHEDNT